VSTFHQIKDGVVPGPARGLEKYHSINAVRMRDNHTDNDCNEEGPGIDALPRSEVAADLARLQT
jgi:hypothetical protein